jgi:hypothetical protein
LEREELSKQLIACVAEREDALKRLAFARVPLAHAIQKLRMPRFLSTVGRLLRKIYRNSGPLVGRRPKPRGKNAAIETVAPTADKVVITREVEEALVTLALRGRSRK